MTLKNGLDKLFYSIAKFLVVTRFSNVNYYSEGSTVFWVPNEGSYSQNKVKRAHRIGRVDIFQTFSNATGIRTHSSLYLNQNYQFSRRFELSSLCIKMLTM